DVDLYHLRLLRGIALNKGAIGSETRIVDEVLDLEASPSDFLRNAPRSGGIAQVFRNDLDLHPPCCRKLLCELLQPLFSPSNEHQILFARGEELCILQSQPRGRTGNQRSLSH